MTNCEPAAPIQRRAVAIAGLLLLSGASALLCQTAWLRQFRSIFGGSTPASAAVLAVFMAGLGAGGLWLGRRADRHPRPLLLYARLEAGAAVSAAASPLLMWLIAQVYLSLGGTLVLGPVLGTVLRLLLAGLALGPATVLMGGSLPAASRAVTGAGDVRRRVLALLYGANTLGAVAGAGLATFSLLEVLGNRHTVWVAALVNLLVAMLARSLARSGEPDAAREPAITAIAQPAPAAPAWLTLGSAAVAGAVFFLMELVWYRLLTPLLGGTTFTFGLILATALAGIGLGGLLYALRSGDRVATLGGLASSCGLEALALAIPLALGDRIALLALLLRPLGAFGFGGHVAAWLLVTALVVLPAALVAGYQFPLLIALLGRGRERVGWHVAAAYAANTGGAIAGALAGGFGLLALLSAPGTWRLAVALLVALALLVAIAALRRRQRALPSLALLAAGAALLCLGALGPTAVWRHSSIGVGRVPANLRDPLRLAGWVREERRALAWEADGVESSVAIHGRDGWSLMVNGKNDGNARHDAGTQVMGGLLGALRRPQPRTAAVIGLGTGTTAGWLGQLPSIERVDVYELEPAVLELARRSALANQRVLENPRVQIALGDARERLLLVRQRYDLVFSAPSNPYRAGVASLFTQEYYRAIAERLADGGVFVQWLQAYEVDDQTLRTVFATLRSVFMHVEIWQAQPGDLLLVAAPRTLPLDLAALAQQIAMEPLRSGLLVAWRASDVVAVLAHYVAGPELADAIAQVEEGFVNTDDKTVLEFWFGRSAGRLSWSLDSELRRRSLQPSGLPRFGLAAGELERAVEHGLVVCCPTCLEQSALESRQADQVQRLVAFRRYLAGDLAGALAAWERQPRAPIGLPELELVAESLADAGAESALAPAAELRRWLPAEADLVLARLRWRQGRLDEAEAALSAGLERCRADPWVQPALLRRALQVALGLASRDRPTAERMWRLLASPFAVNLLDEQRLQHRLDLLPLLDFARDCREALAPFDAPPRWQLPYLGLRLRCAEATDPAAVAAARADLAAYLRVAPPSVLLPDR